MSQKKTRLFGWKVLLFVTLTLSALMAVGTPQASEPADRTASGQHSPIPVPAPGEAEKLQNPPTSSASAKADYSKEAFVVEQLHQHYRFENDGTGRKSCNHARPCAQ